MGSMRAWSTGLILFVAVVTGCGRAPDSGDPPDLVEKPLEATTQAAVQVESVPLVVNVSPYAVCTLGLDGDNSVVRHVYADGNGDVNFWGPTSVVFRLACTADGGNELPVRVVPASSILADLNVRHQLTGAIRLPLTGDLMAPSRAALVKQGYPPRPDPVRAPAAFADWTQKVSQGMTLLPSRAHPDLDDVHNTSCTSNCSGNWSGAEMTLSNLTESDASWVIPAVTGFGKTYPSMSAYYHSSLWNGLDASDVIQAGTQQDVTMYPM